MLSIEKRPNAFWAVWVKGHATEDHMREGITTEQHKEGNHNADQITDIGTNLHGEDIKKLAIAMSYRHHNYHKFIEDVAVHVVEAYLINAELNSRRESSAQAEQKKEDLRTPYKKLRYPTQAQTRNIRGDGSMPIYQKARSTNPHYPQVEKFISNLSIGEADETMKGLTWLQLNVLYRTRGYHKPISDPENGASKKATLDKQLREFKRSTKA